MMMSKIQSFLLFISLSLGFVQCNSPKTSKLNIKQQNDSLAQVFELQLNDLLSVWYPVSIDTLHGGFYSDLSFDWKLKGSNGSQQKMIVQQARHIWTCSQVFLKTKDSTYLKIAKHGYDFIRNYMWDKQYGGFYTILDSSANFTKESFGDEKRAYGNTFAIYALTAYYNASKDTSALNLAMKTFHWLDVHSHDKVNKGYFDLMTRKGNLWSTENHISKTGDAPRAMWKDQNSSIHLLEAFTDLYKVTKDSLVGVRLKEMLTLVRDTFIGNKSYLTLHFTQDWNPISFKDSSEVVRKKFEYYDHVSFGHNVETAYLMLEASEALGIKDNSRTLAVAKKLVDHTLLNAWDSKYGGIFYEGFYFKNQTKLSIVNREKCWWAQAEMLNSLLLMSQKFPNEPKYRECFLKQWNYINTYLIDNTYKGWYFVGLDYRPEETKNNKASIWKINYHDGRALMNCIGMLE